MLNIPTPEPDFDGFEGLDLLPLEEGPPSEPPVSISRSKPSHHSQNGMDDITKVKWIVGSVIGLFVAVIAVIFVYGAYDEWEMRRWRAEEDARIAERKEKRKAKIGANPKIALDSEDDWKYSSKEKEYAKKLIQEKNEEKMKKRIEHMFRGFWSDKWADKINCDKITNIDDHNFKVEGTIVYTVSGTSKTSTYNMGEAARKQCTGSA